MTQHMDISIGKQESHFSLTGDTSSLLANKRLLFSLKRMRMSLQDGIILVPYDTQTEIKTLQQIQDILVKFGLTNEMSAQVRADAESFDREQQNFDQFSNRAREIRDDKFKDQPELVREFDSFQKTLGGILVRKLYPLQLLSAYHMAFAQHACNFAVPGAGKTSIVYAAYAYLKNLPEDHPKHVDKLLVIGPLSSFAPWEKEYQECFGRPANIQRLSGDNRISRRHKEEHLFSAGPAELTLIFHGGVDSMQKEIISFLKRNKTMVVVDEAHRIKNPDGIWGKSIVEIGKEARSRIILTGTPVPNGYEDLFNLYQYLYPYRFKEILGFHYGNLQDMSKNADNNSERVENLIGNISPYFIRIKKSDLGLPPVNEKIIEVPMGARQREIYDFVEATYMDSFAKDSSADIKDVLNKAKLIRLRQAATNPALLLKPIQETLDNDDFESRLDTGGQVPEEFQADSGILSKIRDYRATETPAKFIAAKELVLENIRKGEKTIIWTIFVQNAKELRTYLEANGVKTGLLIGEVEQSDREPLIEQFNNPEDFATQVLIANPFAVAESISLHKGCHNAIYLERDYNCANFLQSKDRIHRVGLKPGQETNYYYLLSPESIDSVINTRLDIKVRRMEQIINDDIPLFARINDDDETDVIKALMEDYAKRA